MQTSYFAIYKNSDGVSIALKTPFWFAGPRYPQLAPTPALLSDYKAIYTKTPKEAVEMYTLRYRKETLDALNPEKVFRELEDKVILCYERSSDFCHRRLVADWIEQSLGVEVPEITLEQYRLHR